MTAAEEHLDWLEPVEVKSGPLKVTREIELEERGAIARFTAVSDADVHISCTVTHAIPSDIPTDEVGFHPEYEPSEWEIRDQTVIVEETLAPGESQTIVFGITVTESTDLPDQVADPIIKQVSRHNEKDGVEESAKEMDITVATPGQEQSESASEPIDKAQKQNANQGAEQGGYHHSQQSESVGHRETEDTIPSSNVSSPKEPSLDLELPEQSQTENEQYEANDSSTNSTSPAGNSADNIERIFAEAEDASDDVDEQTNSSHSRGGSSSMIASLVDEIQAETTSDEELETLRDALGVSAPNSVDVRLRHVQSRMDSLDAYAEVLEEVIDEHGDVSQVVNEHREELETLRTEVEALQEEIDSIHQKQRAASNRLEEIEADAMAVKTLVQDDLEPEIANLRDEVTLFQSMREQLLAEFAEEHRDE